MNSKQPKTKKGLLLKSSFSVENLLGSLELSEALIAIATKYGFIKEIKTKKQDITSSKWAKLVKVVNKFLEKGLPLKDLKKTIQQELGVNLKTAQQISQDINNQIFSKIKKNVGNVHKAETIIPKKTIIPKTKIKPIKKRERKKIGKDTYREQIE